MDDTTFSSDSQEESAKQQAALQLVLHRDRTVLALRDVFRAASKHVREAGRRLDDRIQADIEAMHETKRAHVRTQLALLPVAHKLVLEPDTMNADSGIVIDPHHPPTNFDVLGVPLSPMPRWVHQAYLATNKMNDDLIHMVHNLAGHLRNAQSGRIGDYALPKGINLRRTAPLDAYVFAIGKLWAKGHYSDAEVRDSLTPELVQDTAATAETVLLNVTREVAHAPIEKRVPVDRWWDIALACMLLLDADFDASDACKTPLPPWRGEEEDYDREAMLRIWFETDNRYDLNGLWGWAERSVLYLRHAVAHPVPVVDRPSKDAPVPVSPPESKADTTVINVPDIHAASPDQPPDLRGLTTVQMDVNRRVLLWRGKSASFGGFEWALVHHLFKNIGMSFDSTTLRKLIWPRGVVLSDSSLPSLVGRVRAKMNKAGFPSWVFPSKPRGDYRFVISREVT